MRWEAEQETVSYWQLQQYCNIVLCRGIQRNLQRLFYKISMKDSDRLNSGHMLSINQSLIPGGKLSVMIGSI